MVNCNYVNLSHARSHCICPSIADSVRMRLEPEGGQCVNVAGWDLICDFLNILRNMREYLILLTARSEDRMGEARTLQSLGNCAPRPPSPDSTPPEDPAPAGPARASHVPRRRAGPATPPLPRPGRPGPAEAQRDPARAGPGGPPTRTTKGGAGAEQILMWAAAEGLKKSACTKLLRLRWDVCTHRE